MSSHFPDGHNFFLSPARWGFLSLVGIPYCHPAALHCHYQIKSHLQGSLSSSSFLLSTVKILQILGEKKNSPTWSLPEFTLGHRSFSIMWNTSRRSELHLPQTLGTQCEGNACLLTSQWTCWEQRQSLMFPFISYYLLASTEVIKYTQSTCPEERITWDQLLIPMEQILFENLGNLMLLLLKSSWSPVVSYHTCLFYLTTFLLKPV